LWQDLQGLLTSATAATTAPSTLMSSALYKACSARYKEAVVGGKQLVDRRLGRDKTIFLFFIIIFFYF
jgi:hypothetical protein